MGKYKFEKGFNVKLFIVALSVLLIIGYGLFNSRNLLRGPIIEIWSPTIGAETEENILTVKGRAMNVAAISLNEKPIFVDTDGLFEEKLLLSPGINVIEIKGRDRFKKETKETVTMYYKQTATTTDYN